MAAIADADSIGQGRQKGKSNVAQQPKRKNMVGTSRGNKNIMSTSIGENVRVATTAALINILRVSNNSHDLCF